MGGGGAKSGLNARPPLDNVHRISFMGSSNSSELGQDIDK